MEGKPKTGLKGGLTLKRYVTLWVGSILVSFLVLIAAWYVDEGKLRGMKDKLFAAANALDAGRRLERELLSERREDLLWRFTEEAAHRAQARAALQSAGEIAASLETAGVSPDELQMVDEIRQKLQAFRAATAAAGAKPLPLDQVRAMADGLLASVGRYMRKNQSDLEGTIRDALRIQTWIDYSSISVVVVVAVFLALGSAGLINRVVRPTIELTRVAHRFGKADFSARAAVHRDDELGALCRTVNDMAADIESHEKARLEFVASVAHDIQNPLVTIGGAARRLRGRTLEPGKQQAWLDRILIQVARLENLARDLMDTVQVTTGHLCLNTAEIDLTDLVGTIHAEQAGIFPGHTLVFEGTGECRVRGDRSRLERVTINLVSNACKYSPKDSTVLVAVERRGANAVLSVQDHGAGMSDEEIQVALQLFGRSARTQHMASGTGLGLPIVERIVEAHGGSLHIESQAGEGTTVEILLPLAHGSQGEHSGA